MRPPVFVPTTIGNRQAATAGDGAVMHVARVPQDTTAEVAADVPVLDPPYKPVHFSVHGDSVEALRERILGPTKAVCNFQSQFEDVNGWALPRFPKQSCSSGIRFHAGAVFRVFMTSTPHPAGTTSHEAHEHWQVRAAASERSSRGWPPAVWTRPPALRAARTVALTGRS